MKPKNTVFCFDCQRSKMLFETEKKANTFMKFNNEAILEESGFAPKRAYYCSACGGWHLTHLDEYSGKSFTDTVVEQYKNYKLRKWTSQAIHISSEERKLLNCIREQIERVEELLTMGKIENAAAVCNSILDQVESQIIGSLAHANLFSVIQEQLAKVVNKVTEARRKVKEMHYRLLEAQRKTNMCIYSLFRGKVQEAADYFHQAIEDMSQIVEWNDEREMQKVIVERLGVCQNLLLDRMDVA